MQNFQTIGDPKWLPKTYGANLFKEQSNQPYHKRVALLKRSYIQYAFRLNLRNLDVKVYIHEFLHWCNF